MPIVLESLSHHYRSGPLTSVALDEVSLTVNDGEILALIGHTGSGKSTLAQHLNGLLEPGSGRVLVDGADINEKGASRRALRFKVGLVFQYPEHQLFEETVFKDIAFGPKNMGLSKPEIDDRVREACQQVGLDLEAVGARSPFELSGGQMRRVAIAGVLAMRPGTLILDEPTAGLDPQGRNAILGMIRALHAAGGRTVVMVSHNMDDISTLATRLLVMSRGELVLTGSPREVFRRQKLLDSIGLGVPQAAALCHLLLAQGFPLPDDLCTLDEMADALLRLGKEAGVC